MTGLPKIAVIVGTDERLRSELARVLAAFGLDCLLVEDAAQAADCLDGRDPDLVLVTSDCRDCDAGLAGLPDTMRLYGRNGASLMVCAYGVDAAVLSAAIVSGADECLVAPFDAELVRFKLEQTGVLAIQ